MKINDCHKEEKPSESLVDNATQSSDLSSPRRSHAFSITKTGPQPSNTHPSALKPHYFEKLCTDLLDEGKSVRFAAPGKSMYPVIQDGETLIVEPIVPSAVKVGDIILYKSEEKLIAHRVISIKEISIPNQYSLILRGDAAYSYDEPVYADQILGKVIAIERNGRSINPYSIKHKLSCWARIWKSRIKRIFF
ncbi:MAG: signal peptidase I [Desulfobacterales bacterium]